MKTAAAWIILNLFCILQVSPAIRVTNIEPPAWWAGLKNDTLQLMLTGSDLSGLSVTSPGDKITVLKAEGTTNPSYAFVLLRIAEDAPEGRYPLLLRKGSDTLTIRYQIRSREGSAGRYQGFDARDVIYLITPDRFSDGDPSNNGIPGMKDGYNPDKPVGRHGGDIRGIIDHLDYLSDLGVTALWMNPLIENDTRISYHGYASTDLYRIDSRFGTNDLYRDLVDQAHRHGLKIIMDHVSNHISIDHPWIKNLPDASWLNGSVDRHQNNHHQKALLTDSHSDSVIRSNVTDGWFQDYMPDLNQRNPLLARYLIQNTIWWIESTGLDGIREDTYSYSDPDFLARWTTAIFREYPHFNIVGEVWLNDPVYIAPYQEGCCLSHRETHLPSVTDFGLFTPFMRVFGKDHDDISVIHECLGKDFLYPSPDRLVTFLDNHDVTRIMSICKGNAARFKLALTLLLTLRGIPEMLYGTEIGMEGEGDHGLIRSDFPGGFPHATHNAFTSSGRSALENELHSFTKKLLSIRRVHPSLQIGQLIHFLPEKNVYCYFRILPDETTLVIANNGDTPVSFIPAEAGIDLKTSSSLKNLLTGEETGTLSVIRVDGNSAGIFQVLTKRDQ